MCEAHFLLDWVKWRLSSGAEKVNVQERKQLSMLEAVLDNGTSTAERPLD